MSCTGRASCPRIGSGALRDDLGRHGALARDQHQLAAPVADREAVVVARLQRADNVGHLVLPGPGRRRPVPAHHHPSADVLWPDPDHVPVAHRTLELTGPRSAPEPERGYPGSDSEEHTSELQSRENLVCRLLLEKKKKKIITHFPKNKQKKKKTK